jgi:DNA modification methylase
MKVNYIENVDSMKGLKSLPDKSINCCVTSPPYYNLRSYGIKGEFGCEKTPEEFVDKLCNFYDEVFRVLKDDGVVFCNLGDTYLGSDKGVWKGREEAQKVKDKPKEKMGGWRKPKQLALIPFRFAIEMQNRGWLLRNNIVWHKKNALPQSCKDRFVTDFESIFMFTKKKKYFFNQQIEPFANTSNPDEIYTGKATKDYDKSKAQNPSDTKRRILERMKERGGRSMRSVWTINTKPNKSVHTATFPEELVERMLKSGCPEGGVVLDFFMGSGTTGVVAKKLNMNYIGFDLNPEYCEVARKRINDSQ